MGGFSMLITGLRICCIAVMRRTSIELDEKQLARVQRVLGTDGVKDTIDRAFGEVLRADLRRRLARRIRGGEGVDRDARILDASRRWAR